MSAQVESDWALRARAAVGWREGESIEPVLEALALSVALEVTGALAEVPPSLRDELRRVGQRALLHLSAEIAAHPEREEALRIAAAYGRDGLRALAGKPLEREPATEPPTARELARLLAGTAEPLESAAIARRARGSEQARRELAWALRLRRGGIGGQAGEADPGESQALAGQSGESQSGAGEAGESQAGAGHAAQGDEVAGDAPRARIRLAAADGEPMRDPSAGRHLASIRDGDTVVAEVFAFGGGALAVYAASGQPVRLEGPGLRTDAMQAGYWSGRTEIEQVPAGAGGEGREGGGEGKLARATLHVGERRFAIAVPVE